MVRSLGLDLGSTRIKVGALGDDGQLTVLGTTPSPPLTGIDPIREGDPFAYLDAATELLLKAVRDHPGVPIGITSQRSSFLIWRNTDGRPSTLLISWQDRRASAWCDEMADQANAMAQATGLVLSPHYVGPKLATLLRENPGIAEGLAGGDLSIGTLESYLLWQWADVPTLHTDLSMAARTMMVGQGGASWDSSLLALFGVPRKALPVIGPSCGLNIPILGQAVVTATVADQAAAALALGAGPETALVNLGTGGFVMRMMDHNGAVPPGFLAGPLFGEAGQGGDAIAPGPIALEGTINGIGPALDRLAPVAVPLLDEDPTPDAFCLPDSTGVGAPHWRPEKGLIWSAAAKGLDDTATRRVMLEGIVFRAWEIAVGMAPEHPPSRLVLAGGIANDPFVAPALAACSGVEVEALLEPEATLLGVAQLAAGVPTGGAGTRALHTTGGAYLAQKYHRWQSWMAGVLD